MNLKGISFAITMLAAGTACSLVTKSFGQIDVSPGPSQSPVPYNHPAILTTLMFIGEFSSFPVYGAKKCFKKDKPVKRNPDKKPYKLFPHIFLFLAPTCFDLIASQLSNAAFYYALASVAQILKNLTLVLVALLSFICFKSYRKTFDLDKGVGLILIIAGIGVAGWASVGFTDSAAVAATNPVMGALLMVASCVFGAFFYISEEFFLRRIDADPMQGVGSEGFWGLILYAILLPIMNKVNDPFGDGNMADLSTWAYQFKNSPLIIGLTVYHIFNILLFNISGMSITKYFSSSTRVTLDALKTIFIWAGSFALGLEKWNSKSTPITIAAFIVLTIGVFTYNRVIIKLPNIRKANKILASDEMVCESEVYIEISNPEDLVVV